MVGKGIRGGLKGNEERGLWGGVKGSGGKGFLWRGPKSEEE